MEPFQTKLEQIQQLKAKIDAFGQWPDDIKRKIDYKLRLDWNYHSNAIEGGTLTVGETRGIMMGNITVDGKPLRDVLEMKGHDDVVHKMLKMGKQEINITEARIKEVHKAVIHEDTEKKIYPGEWKRENNYLYNYRGERIDFVPANEVKDEMHKLINWLNAEKEKVQRGQVEAALVPLIAFDFHLRYVTIHPFGDGNGRTARLFTNLVLISFGYPPIIVKEDEKDEYGKLLADVQVYDAPNDMYYAFMCELLLRSMQLVDRALHGEEIEEPQDWKKRLYMLDQQLNVSNIILVKRNPEAVELLSTKYVDYFLSIVKELKFAQRFFIDNQATGSASTYSTPSYDFFSDKRPIQQVAFEIYAMQFRCRFVGLKTSPGVDYSFNFEIQVELNDFGYNTVFKAQGARVLDISNRAYNLFLSEEEITQATNSIGTALVAFIEKHTPGT